MWTVSPHRDSAIEVSLCRRVTRALMCRKVINAAEINGIPNLIIWLLVTDHTLSYRGAVDSQPFTRVICVSTALIHSAASVAPAHNLILLCAFNGVYPLHICSCNAKLPYRAKNQSEKSPIQIAVISKNSHLCARIEPHCISRLHAVVLTL